jgi:SAM-dependent methyltransferase
MKPFRQPDTRQGDWRAVTSEGEVVTVSVGGCLWAGDPDGDGITEALVLGATVRLATGYAAERSWRGGGDRGILARMKLNALETWLMNNPLRAWVQRYVEAPRLLDLGGRTDGLVCLEIGCGRGVGVEIILERFGAAHVDAFDLDERMVERARQRLAAKGRAVRLWCGDAGRIAADDASYDAVFDFTILHHVPDWRGALGEIVRVLRPGGRLFAEEVLARLIRAPLVRRLVVHPAEDRFSYAGFIAGLRASGFELQASRNLGGVLGAFVARRPE